MKIKLSYMYFGFLTFFAVVFGVYAVKCGPYREMDAYMMDMIERDKEYYDEEMAVRLAEAWGTDTWQLQGWPAERAEIVYNYPTNEWIVIFTRNSPRWNRIVIGVRRDNGTMERYG